MRDEEKGPMIGEGMGIWNAPNSANKWRIIHWIKKFKIRTFRPRTVSYEKAEMEHKSNNVTEIIANAGNITRT